MGIDTDILFTWGAVYRMYEKGEIIFKEDTHAHFYHQVTEGSVKMVNCNDHGKEFIQGIFESGDSFGEPPLFYNGTYPASAVADTKCTLLRLRKERLMEILKDNPTIHHEFTSMLAQRLNMKAIVARELACYQPEHRVQTMLDLIRTKTDVPKINGNRIKVPYTRQQMADMTGLRVETVIRTIRTLENKGLLEIEGGKVFIPA